MNNKKTVVLSGIALAFCAMVLMHVHPNSGATQVSVASDTHGAFDRAQLGARLGELKSFSCGERTDEFVRELKIDLDSMPAEVEGVGAAFDVCGADFESEVFVIGDDIEAINGGFLIGTNAPADTYFWVFVFLNEREVTQEILGSKNLVLAKKGDVLTIPLKFARPDRSSPSVLSVLAVDARIIDDDRYRYNSVFVSTEIRPRGGNKGDGFSGVDYIDGAEGSYNPYPAGLSYATITGQKSSKTELIFSLDPSETHQQHTAVFIDFKNGRRIHADCGSPSEGLVSIKHRSTETIRIHCNLSGYDLPRNVLAVLAPDYFLEASESNESGAHGASFLRFYQTH